ncbi:dual specificity mitogen-activated protein kinase kinase 4 [Nilaparvata lugens]|uniref:dual specificity mitogen-activated protein kinase kinase 4 n=1 Tax=Nilaparvata lugens TaxID=108931 RepID=UPI00193CF337|nr:dual specificity mitogen-activated protein kinase kinase 4 [Nilaparvata lugens]
MAESQGKAVPTFSSFDNIERRPGSHDRRNKLKLFSSLPISSHTVMNNTNSGHSDLMNLSALSRYSPTTIQHHPHHHHHHTHHNNHHSQHNSHHNNHQSHHGNHQSHHGNHHSHHGNNHSHHGHHHSHQAASPQAGSRFDGATGGGGELARRSLSIRVNSVLEKFKFCQSIQSTGTLQVSPNDCYDFTSDDMQDLGEIGRGAFGTVNKMVHRTSGTVMAVKRIRSTVDEKEQKQLLMDLEVVMKSNECPCIVQFYGALFKEGDCWICMELMDTSLDKFYKFIYEKLNQRIPETTLGKITVATVRALNYLKEKLKIIHRDVKPSNILLDRRGNIKLCDFGISGQLVDSIARTRDAGCRPYMAVS